MRYALPVAAVAALSLLSGAASAGCGGSFCSIATDEDALGPWTKPGWRVDLRGEFVRQSTLRSGRDKVSPAAAPDSTDESLTRNRNLLASLDYAWDERWGATVTLPWVGRRHEHTAYDAAGAATAESWRFGRAGDARIVGRYQISGLPDHEHAFGVQFGLKLPTGSTTVANGDGTRAERALQPGTGTTDLVLGAYYHAHLSERTSGFVQVSAVNALNSHEDYRPGRQVTLNLGVSHRLTDAVNGLLQLNAVHRASDRGVQAEPEDSGSTQLFLSPGLSVAVGKAARVYAYLQLPLSQRVTGTQLTADRSIVVGYGQAF